MISEKLTVMVPAPPIAASQPGGAGGAATLTAIDARGADVVLVTSQPVVVLVATPAPSSPTCRPPRAPGSATPGWASAPAPPPAPGKAGSSTKAGGSTTSSTKAKSTPSAKSTASAKSSGPLAFLDDKKMSVDEKLFRLAMYMADKADKDLEKKIKELRQAKASTSKSSGSGGLLGGLGGVLGKAAGDALGGGTLGVMGPLGAAVGMGLGFLKESGATKLIAEASGPVLAAGACSIGLPELAPAAMKLGPTVVGGALDAAQGLASSASPSSASGSGSTSTSSTGADGELSKSDLMELEYMQQKQQQMFSLLSNLMKGLHDTRMSVIGNLRA